MNTENKPALIIATEMAMQVLNESSSTLEKLALINMPEGTTPIQAQRRVLKELTNFEMICTLKPELAAMDKMSIVMAVKQSICDNLTLSPAAGLVYLYPGKVCVGMNGSTKIYKEILQYEPTAEGHLSIARQAKAILDHKRPEVRFDDSGKVASVKFEFLVPAHPEPRWESVIFDSTDFERWKTKSAAKFNGNANANYTSHKGGMDPEFARAKAIKHGLKKRGRNANEIYVDQAPNITETITHEEIKKKPAISNTENSNWVAEKSSGYDGFRCTKCHVWIYENQGKKCNCNTIQNVEFEEVKSIVEETAKPKLDLPDTNDLF